MQQEEQGMLDMMANLQQLKAELEQTGKQFMADKDNKVKLKHSSDKTLQKTLQLKEEIQNIKIIIVIYIIYLIMI